MMVRHGIGVRYSHDAEALMSELSSWPEFSGMEKEIMDEIERGGALYYYIPEAEEFVTGGSRYLPLLLRAGRAVPVNLFDVQAFTEYLRSTCGYCCTICGTKTRFEDRAKRYWANACEEVREAVMARQRWLGMELICQPCSLDLWMMFGTEAGASIPDLYAENFVRRVEAAKASKETPA